MSERSQALMRRIASLWIIVLLAGGFVVASAVASSGGHDHSSHDHGDHDHSHPAVRGNDPFGLATAAPSEHAPDRDPCGLLTAEEASVVLSAVSDVRERGAPATEDQRVCWYGLESNIHLGAVVGITDRQAAGKLRALQEFYGERMEPLAGVGDEARWLAPFRTLVTVQGDWLVSVQMLTLNDALETSRLKAIALAQVAVDRL